MKPAAGPNFCDATRCMGWCVLDLDRGRNCDQIRADRPKPATAGPSLADQLEQLQADGRITPDDADEVRTFAAFLADAGPPPGKSGHDPARKQAALRRHYPDEAAAIDALIAEAAETTDTETESIG